MPIPPKLGFEAIEFVIRKFLAKNKEGIATIPGRDMKDKVRLLVDKYAKLFSMRGKDVNNVTVKEAQNEIDYGLALSKQRAKEEALKKFPPETHKFFGRPLTEKDFKEIVQEKYAKEKRGLVRAVGQLFGRSTEALGTPHQRLQEQRIFKQREYLERLKRGYGKGGINDTYGPKQFARDVRNADADYYTKRQGQIEKDGDPYVDEHSYEESSENIIASEQYYDMMEVYYDKELEETDPARFELQDKLFLGQEVELKDGSVIGNWTPEQIEYVSRNINDLYYEPEVLEKMMQYGQMGVYPLKYWHKDRKKSEDARKRFKNAGSPGSALDPNAVFLWDSRTFNLRVQVPEKVQEKVQAYLPFINYLNENAEIPPTPTPRLTPVPVGADAPSTDAIMPWPTPSAIGTKPGWSPR